MSKSFNRLLILWIVVLLVSVVIAGCNAVMAEDPPLHWYRLEASNGDFILGGFTANVGNYTESQSDGATTWMLLSASVGEYVRRTSVVKLAASFGYEEEQRGPMFTYEVVHWVQRTDGWYEIRLRQR